MSFGDMLGERCGDDGIEALGDGALACVSRREPPGETEPPGELQPTRRWPGEEAGEIAPGEGTCGGHSPVAGGC